MVGRSCRGRCMNVSGHGTVLYCSVFSIVQYWRYCTVLYSTFQVRAWLSARWREESWVLSIPVGVHVHIHIPSRMPATGAAHYPLSTLTDWLHCMIGAYSHTHSPFSRDVLYILCLFIAYIPSCSFVPGSSRLLSPASMLTASLLYIRATVMNMNINMNIVILLLLVVELILISLMWITYIPFRRFFLSSIYRVHCEFLYPNSTLSYSPLLYDRYISRSVHFCACYLLTYGASQPSTLFSISHRLKIMNNSTLQYCTVPI